MTVTIDLPDDAFARLRFGTARRRVSIDTVIAELAGQVPAGTDPLRRLSYAETLDAEPELAERAAEILEGISR